MVWGCEYDVNEFCKQGKFSIKKLNIAARPQLQKTPWKRLVLGADTIPRHQFILWLTLNQRLATVDRLAKWKIDVPKDCVLCTSQKEEMFDHLFFECEYAKSIWAILLNWLGERHSIESWEKEVQWLTKRTNNGRPRAQVVIFLFAATIYYTWLERNMRRFQKQYTTYAGRIREIVLQLHIKGQQRSKWKTLLDQLNSFSTCNNV
ncbi:uncharacterized protein [Nicotiana tomentosiformis]|uniref:uncharacterized protein n=1 Tax=Nicotiana tomentosiformis TaxID=4098 RepID=UPI00051C901B|nr:uncharacterized protein LOC104095331 [Nicotiana tomentosiformis]